MKINYETIISAGDMSLASLTSTTINLDFKLIVAIQAVYTGSPVGTLKLQGSIGGTSWSDISGSSTAITTSGDVLYNITDIGYRYIRAVYTKTSGTGSLTVEINAKGI